MMVRSTMRIVIRADASVSIGTGHVMRCLTLADMLKEQGADVVFACRQTAGNLCSYIEQRGYQLIWLPDGLEPEQDAERTAEAMKSFGQGKKADWMIVDHYGLDARWEEAVQPAAHRMMVIDDLANRPHNCDILLDQNYYLNIQSRYRGLVPDGCLQLLGPNYLLLRPEFYKAREKCTAKNGRINRLLVFFGGSDPTEETIKALNGLVSLLEYGSWKGRLDVVVGRTNPQHAYIEQLCQNLPNTSFYCQIENMADLILQCDFALGAGGVTMWERSFLGLPSLVAAVADNQVESIEAAVHAGIVRSVGWHEHINENVWKDACKDMLGDPDTVHRMSQRALTFMAAGGTSATHPVVCAIMEEKA